MIFAPTLVSVQPILTPTSKTEELASLVNESRVFMSKIAKAKTAKLSE